MVNSTIKRIARNNAFVNSITRNVIRVLLPYFPFMRKFALRMRIWGNVNLDVSGTRFKIYSEADDHIANEIYYNLGYEIDEFKLIRAITQRTTYFIDVGANTGIFSIYVASANPSVKVLSFEPHPSNYKRFQKNVSINKLQNINILPRAVGAANNTIEFTIPSDLSISATASVNENFTKNFHKGVHFKKLEIEQCTVDTALAGISLSSLDVIKIDVEYYELEVLKGALSILKNTRPIVIIEILQFDKLVGQFPEMRQKISENHAFEIFDFLIHLNYHAYSITPSGIRLIESVGNESNRNFLFLPTKLGQHHYSFEEIEKLYANPI